MDNKEERYGVIYIPFELYTFSKHISLLYSEFIPVEINVLNELELYQIKGWSPQFKKTDLDKDLPLYNPIVSEEGITFVLASIL